MQHDILSLQIHWAHPMIHWAHPESATSVDVMQALGLQPSDESFCFVASVNVLVQEDPIGNVVRLETGVSDHEKLRLENAGAPLGACYLIRIGSTVLGRIRAHAGCKSWASTNLNMEAPLVSIAEKVRLPLLGLLVYCMSLSVWALESCNRHIYKIQSILCYLLICGAASEVCAETEVSGIFRLERRVRSKFGSEVGSSVFSMGHCLASLLVWLKRKWG